MAKLLKLRRGTTTQHGSFTGAEGEVTVDTDKETLVVHDGSTAGGHPVAAEDMANVSSASIAGRLSNDSIATSKIAAGALPSDVTVTNANVVSNAAIAGTKVSPDFGSQNISTTGTIGSSNITITNTQPFISLQDSDNEKLMKQMIAEFAILANSFVGEYLKSTKLIHKGIFRTCEAKDWLNNTSDTITSTSTSGERAEISIVDVSPGSVEEVAIDNPGTGYSVGQDLYFNNANTEGTGASAKITCVGGAVAPEAGDIAAYGMDTFDHIVYEDATEATDAYSGNQIQLETQTFTDLGVAAEAGEVVNIKTFSGGSGYEIVPTVVATTATIRWSTLAETTSGQFKAGETITTSGGASGTLAVLRTGNASIVGSTGTFAEYNTITGSTSGAKAVLTSVTTHGTGATFVAWAQKDLGAVKGLEVTNFGTGYTSAPTLR